MRQTRFLLRQLIWETERNLLVRPATLLVAHVVAALALPVFERSVVDQLPAAVELKAWIALEPSTAQLLMATVASALMTVIAVVYSILLVALALASMQFSTRIVAGFMRDPLSRTVLGVFVGAFAYCLTIIRAVHLDPDRVPTFSVLLGFFLTIASLATLVLYIHHITRSIQANVIVDRIADDTEDVIGAVFRTAPGTRADPPPALAHTLRAERSGYIQLIDAEGLVELARGRTFAVQRRIGAFIPAGAPLLTSAEEISIGDAREIHTCFDIGAERTMQEDVEYGYRQIVDIALKAISPAVNDPSTAATCIDHLGRLLMHAAPRPPPSTCFGGSVFIPAATFVDLIDLCFEQLRQYGKNDMAVCLRLMRVLGEVSSVAQPTDRPRLRYHADAILRGAEQAFSLEDCEELRRRAAMVIA